MQILHSLMRAKYLEMFTKILFLCLWSLCVYEESICWQSPRGFLYEFHQHEQKLRSCLNIFNFPYIIICHSCVGNVKILLLTFVVFCSLITKAWHDWNVLNETSSIDKGLRLKDTSVLRFSLSVQKADDMRYNNPLSLFGSLTMWLIWKRFAR